MDIRLLILLIFTLASCNSEKMKSENMALEKELETTKAQLEETKSSVNNTSGLVHSVFFWLKEDLSKEDEAGFLNGLQTLSSIETVNILHHGPTALTKSRDVVDQSFSYAAFFYFDDIEGQDAYQIDPIHLKFVEDHKDKWTKVIVYDSLLPE